MRILGWNVGGITELGKSMMIRMVAHRSTHNIRVSPMKKLKDGGRRRTM